MHPLQHMNHKMLMAVHAMKHKDYDSALKHIEEALVICTVPNIVDFARNLEAMAGENFVPPKRNPATLQPVLDTYFIH